MDYLQPLLSDVTIMVPDLGALIAIIIAGILLVFSGFASGSEIAFFSLSPTDLSELDENKNDSDSKIQQLRDDSERTLATILITNNLVNVTIIMLCNYFFAHVIDFGGAYWLQFLVITVLLTFLLLLFGEIMPKVYAGQHALSFCRRAVGSIMVLRRIFWPLSSLLIRSGIIAEKVVQKENRALSVDDLEQALELTDEDDLKDEKNMLEGIVRFGDETAKEVMTSRQDVVDLDLSDEHHYNAYQEQHGCGGEVLGENGRHNQYDGQEEMNEQVFEFVVALVPNHDVFGKIDDEHDLGQLAGLEAHDASRCAVDAAPEEVGEDEQQTAQKQHDLNGA